MSFKKTVTFTASVSDYTDGTVTARVQAENNILSQFVAWLLTQNASISQLEKVEIGSSRWSGYPLYDVQSSAPSEVTTSVIESWSKLSDVYILGKSKDNFCLAVSVDGDVLSLAPCCSFDYQDSLNSYSSMPLSICLEQIRKLASSRQETKLSVMGSISIITFDTSSDELSLTLNYWRGSDSLVFGVSGKTDRVFFSLNSIDASWGWSVSNGELCGYSFNEVIQAAQETQTLYNNSQSSVIECLSKGYATSFEPFWWGSMDSEYSGVYYDSTYYSPVAIIMHVMSSRNADDVGIYNAFGLITSVSRVACGIRLDNFPRITTEQLYLRKMYIPNRQTTSPIKLGYTPGNLYQDAIYTVNDKHYLCLQDGWYSFFVEVADQG